MLDLIKKIVRFLLRIKRFRFYDFQAVEQTKEDLGLIQGLYQLGLAQGKPVSRTIEGVIFSKDRVIQLHALLVSLKKQCEVVPSLHILYSASNESQIKAYNELISLFPEHRFYLEKGKRDFKNRLVKIFDVIVSGHVFFLVDDIVCSNPISFSQLLEVDCRFFIPSIRLGLNLEWSYVVNKSQSLPEYQKSFHEQMIEWEWKKAERDWSYPMSLDGNIFLAKEMQFIVNNFQYKSPNTFESELHRVLGKVFNARKGICYRMSRIFNVPCNKVQEIFENRHGDTEIEFLLEKWNTGYMIDPVSYEGYLNTSVHEEIDFQYKCR